MEIAGIKRYHILVTGANKIPADDVDQTQGFFNALKSLNFTAYNELITAQEDMAWFHISKEEYTRDNKYRLCKKFSKCELYDVIRKPKEWITRIELLREFINNLDARIEN